MHMGAASLLALVPSSMGQLSPRDGEEAGNVLHTVVPSSSSSYEMKPEKGCILVSTFTLFQGIQTPGHLIC